MVQLQSDVRGFASSLLEMLDRGDIDAAKLTLREILDDLESDSDGHAPSPQDIADRLEYVLPDVLLGSGTIGAHFLAFGLRSSGPQGELQAVHRSRSLSGATASRSDLSELRTAFQDVTQYLMPVHETIVRCSFRTRREAITTWEGRAIAAECGHTPYVATSPPTREDTAQLLLELLRAQSARESVSAKSWSRLVVLASEAGMTQRQIARAVRKNQTYVNRQLKTAAEDPAILSLSPRELYDHHLSGALDRKSLLTALAAYPYESGSFPEEAREWGYVPGSMDELTALALEGSISPDEFEVVLTGVDALKAARHGR